MMHKLLLLLHLAVIVICCYLLCDLDSHKVEFDFTQSLKLRDTDLLIIFKGKQKINFFVYQNSHATTTCTPNPKLAVSHANIETSAVKSAGQSL